MTLYLVAWLSVAYDCPLWARPLPQQARNYACSVQKSIKTRVFDPARRRDAERHIEALGPGETAVLIEIHGTQAKALSATWKPVLRLE